MVADSKQKREHEGQETAREECVRRWIVSLASLVIVVFFSFAMPCRGDVIVIANRTPSTVPAEFQPAAGSAQRFSMAPGEVVPFFLDGRAHVLFSSAGDLKRYALNANSAYYFGTADGRLDLQQIGLGDDPSTAGGRPLPGRAVSAPLAMIPVKILVDEEEPARTQYWQRRLSARVEAASAVLEKYCRVQLKVVAYGTWNTDNSTTDFFASLAEFEREAKPFPAQLAIGFTSQYQVTSGRTHFAGTRGSLHSHILVRDWARQMTEPERLELLVHELGHFMGASHSPEPDSVMRPVLGNRNAVRREFQVRFDPVNTLIMSMVGEELRRRKIRRIADMTPESKLRLRQIYQALSPTLPDDPAAHMFVQRMNAATVQPLLLATRQVVAHVSAVAQLNQRLPEADATNPTDKFRRTGDALTEYYVRQAAGIARFLPEDVAPNSCLLGLGIALDDTKLLRHHPQFGAFARSVETDAERSLRLAALGEPTMRGRKDLAQHFFVSAHLAALTGTKVAEAAGLAKELADANGGTGFSFADVAANRAGILFAGGVLNRRFSLPTISESFTTTTYMPAVEELAEGLSAAELLAQFGEQSDKRFTANLRRIDERLLELPPYRRSQIAIER